MASRLLDVKEVSKLTGRTPGALCVMRCRGSRPNFIKRGSNVLYRESEVISWLKECAKIGKGKAYLKAIEALQPISYKKTSRAREDGRPTIDQTLG